MLNSDFLDMLCALNDAGADYLVIGAYAMSAHGYSRSTGDIDVWVRPTPENAPRVLSAIRKFGAPLFDLTVEDLYDPDVVFQIGLAPRRIDILTSIAGVDFDRAWADRKQVEAEGTKFCVLSKQHLIENKRAAGRPKDLHDAAWLEEDLNEGDDADD